MRLVAVPILLILSALTGGLVGCSRKADMMPGARLIQSGDVRIWSVCDRGARIYFTDRGIAQVIPLGCLDGQP